MSSESAQWHYVKEGQQVGPVTREVLAELLANGVIQPDTLAWRAGFDGWLAINAIAELESILPVTGSLHLNSGQQNYETANTRPGFPVAGDVQAPIDVKDALSFNVTQQAEAEAAQTPGGIMAYFYIYPFEVLFFWVTAIIGLITTGVLYFVNPDLMFAPMAIQGVLCILAGAIVFRIQAFRESIWWGLGGMFISIVDLIFLFSHWDRVSRCVSLMFAGGAVLAGVLFLVPSPGFEEL